jgi:bacillithiol synthase
MDSLCDTNRRLPESSARERHLEQLAQPGTVAVVTGQQVGLFLGPLFTLYKAAATIVAARALAEETGTPCVPVFWLQTEDHDLPEIDHCFVPRGSEPLRLALGDQGGDGRSPVGQRRIGASIGLALGALRDELGRQPHAEEHLALLEAAYREDATLAEAFASVISSLFAEQGLIVIDPRAPGLAPLAAPVHRRALDEASALASALQERSQALADAGFSEQVHIRPGSPLSFYSPDGGQGPRHRLDPSSEPGRYDLVGRAGAFVSTSQLHDHLTREPERFTTSALLRPVLQDRWLPTAAYVGGPGELSYFAQLAPVYETFGLPMPLVVPRARFRVLDEGARALLEKLGLVADDAALPKETLLERISARSLDSDETAGAIEARLCEAVVPALARFGEQVAPLDPSLAKAAARTDAAVRDAISRLVAKYGRVRAQRDEVTVERVERLQSFLAPSGMPQERCYGFPYFACRFGADTFVRLIFEACVPFSGELRDLTP